MVRNAASSPTLFLLSGWTGLRKTTNSISCCRGGDGTPKLKLLHTHTQPKDRRPAHAAVQKVCEMLRRES
uniref:Uncharacterized protein n=1 Tax=Caenorhabditis japonica TaxID=281687 RepID=A0A8R1I5F8_CAEJA